VQVQQKPAFLIVQLIRTAGNARKRLDQRRALDPPGKQYPIVGRTSTSSPTTFLFCVRKKLISDHANAQGEPCKAAGADVRLTSELTGCLSLASLCGLAFENGTTELNA